MLLIFYIDLLLDDDLEYGDQSYIQNAMLRNPPPIPAPLPPEVRKGLLKEDEMTKVNPSDAISNRTSSLERATVDSSISNNNQTSPLERATVDSSTSSNNAIPLPAEMTEIDPSFKEGSLDELIGLAPEREEEKSNVKELLTKVKGQTTQVFNKLFRRGTKENVDLLGIQSEASGNESTVKDPFASSTDLNHPTTKDPFTSSTNTNHPPVANANDDVADLFGMSFDQGTRE